jgi:sugar lactone lactonase YvrE
MNFKKPGLLHGVIATALILSNLRAGFTQPLPPIFDGVPSNLLKAQTVAERPRNTFLENLVFDSAGRALVTSHEDGVIYRYTRGKPLAAFAQVPGKVTGIASGSQGHFFATGSDRSGRATIFSISPGGSVRTLVTINDGLFLNGIARLEGQRYLVADSYKGAVWLVDVRKRTATVWLQHALLERADKSSPFPAANGIKVIPGKVIVSNTAKQLLLSIPIIAPAAAGVPTVLKDHINVDDFAVEKDGTLYAATHVYNSVVRIAPSGQITTIAGPAEGMTGSTAVAFGKTVRGLPALYVTTNGGMFLPPADGVQSAKLVEIALAP